MTIFRSFGPAARSAAPAACTSPPTPRGTDAATAPPARRFNKLRRSVSGLRRLGIILISFRTVVDAIRALTDLYSAAFASAGSAASRRVLHHLVHPALH